MNMPPTPDLFVARAESLAEPARLRLLSLLEGHELAVSDLAEILQLPQSTVSRHLKVLADQGWIAARGERTANLYRMLDGDLPAPAARLWQLAREEMRGWPALEHDRLRLERCLERRRGSGDFFASVADEWDHLRRELYGERFTDDALRELLPADWTVADLACGSGSVAALLAPRVAEVIAVDLSPEMLEAASRRIGAAAGPGGNVDLRQGALEQLPIASATCDAALLLLALTHVEEPARAVAEMARILKPGGRAVIVDLLRHDREEFRRRMGQRRNGFDAAELASLLADAGLEGVTCSALPTDPASKGPALLLAAGSRPAAPRDDQASRTRTNHGAGRKPACALAVESSRRLAGQPSRAEATHAAITALQQNVFPSRDRRARRDRFARPTIDPKSGIEQTVSSFVLQKSRTAAEPKRG
jgi:ArsR family transcriptional regulator